VVIEHEKEGRTHRHVLWSRIDLEHMRAVPMDHDYAIHQRTARELEQAFGLARVASRLDRDGPHPARGPKAWEEFRGMRSGSDPRAVTAEVSALWQETTTGMAFAAALAARGYRLAQGDRRDFCLIDRAGDDHSLARRLDGVTAAQGAQQTGRAAGRVAGGLVEMVGRLLDRVAGPPREITPAAVLANPALRQAYAAQQLAAVQRETALTALGQAQAQGRALEPAQVARLHYRDWQRLRGEGEAGLRALVAEQAQARQQAQQRGRERDR
jgi:hypothetical protein